MLDTVKKIYNAQELPGEAWVQPLKRYNGFIAKYIKACPCLTKRALRVTMIFLNIFAYPIVLPLAAVGMLIKLTGVREVSVHNRAKKDELERILHGIQNNETVIRSGNVPDISPEWKRVCLREVQVSKDNLAQAKTEIEQEIDKQTVELNKIYLVTAGMIRKSKGSLAVQVEILEKA